MPQQAMPTPIAGELTAIRPAATRQDLTALAALWREYAALPGVGVCVQGLEAELAALPGRYAPPSGVLLLAGDHAQPLGCVALRPLDGAACEMKRLYVRPAGRGRGLGRRLAEAACTAARAAGYRRIVLETLPSMATARGLYAALGFEPVAAWGGKPVAGALHLGLELVTPQQPNTNGEHHAHGKTAR